MQFAPATSMNGTTDAPNCHRCGAPPVHQWMRYANAEESAAQRAEIAVLQGRQLDDEEIARRYGPLRVAVTGCALHHLGDDPTYPDSGLDRRAVLHQADCAGHSECRCDIGENP